MNVFVSFCKIYTISNRHVYRFPLFNVNYSSTFHFVLVFYFVFGRKEDIDFYFIFFLSFFYLRQFFIIHAVTQCMMVVITPSLTSTVVIVACLYFEYTHVCMSLPIFNILATIWNEPRVNLCTAYIAFEFNEMALLLFFSRYISTFYVYV